MYFHQYEYVNAVYVSLNKVNILLYTGFCSCWEEEKFDKQNINLLSNLRSTPQFENKSHLYLSLVC